MIIGIGSGIFEESFEEPEGDKVVTKTVGFHFGPLASAYSEAAAGMTIVGMFSLIEKGLSLYLIHYFYGAARAYYEIREERKHLTTAIVTDWMTKIGAQRCTEIYSKSLEQYVPNVSAPTEGQNHL